MMSMCPVCNGMLTIQLRCPTCSALMDDRGKVSDFYAPYSPYREIDHINMDNGMLDVQNHQCLHMAYCPICQKEETVSVQELT